MAVAEEYEVKEVVVLILADDVVKIEDELDELELEMMLDVVETVLEVVLMAEDDDEDKLDVDVDVGLGLEELELDVGLVLDVLEVDVDDGVGVGVGVDDGDDEELGGLELEAAFEGDELDDPDDPYLPLPDPDPPTSKTSMTAFPPLGTVATQKLVPPAPVLESELVTVPGLLTDGSIEQGKPLHPPPGQVILRPKVGVVPASSDAMKIGFQSSLTKVLPELSVLAPETYGDQFPCGFESLPQMQASEVPTPGGLT